MRLSSILVVTHPMIGVATLALMGVVCSCSGDSSPATGKDGADAGTEPAAEAPEPAEAEVTEAAYVVVTTSMKKQPSDAKKIEDPSGESDAKVSNWITTLYRGEPVSALEHEDGWTRVHTSAGDEGWIKSDKLAIASDIELATTFDELKTFGRPDLMTHRSGKTVGAGNLLYILKEKDQFSHVNFPRSEWSASEAWVLSEKLNRTNNELEAAKMVMRIRTLSAKKDEMATALTDLARAQLGDTEVMKGFEAELAEAVAAAAQPEAGADTAAGGEAAPAPQ